MNRTTIFLAAPISGFQSDGEYSKYRQCLLALINRLSKSYEVYSELTSIDSSEQYDTPEESAKIDFYRIQQSDVFLMYHPMRMQSSTLIELGYAVALKKKIIIISNTSNLPYLATGLHAVTSAVEVIASSQITDQVIEETMHVLQIFYPTK